MILEDDIEIEGQTYLTGGEIGEGTVGRVIIVEGKGGKKYALKVINQYGRNPIVKHVVDK